ncbi:MAG: hypothetical protein UU78_C0091G0011 [Candidatus Roizmanbacteria bacterium GW2011_GWC2_41_7]|uniref:Uncharacterized protein n=1 Tax=Candidatus Roizmanbacteria bacterium GW2011_GWC2_41_7 TaxID=1618487 RepID=A0A0G0X2D2_9BACT|nr:MAG: hypothetical protein UU78_C0091G0011 [Candidatus Roizmanbacteria bacterium GW2011_GWC2_41_7]
MRKLSCFIISFLLTLIIVPSVHAAKLRVRKTSGGIVRSYSSVKLSRNTNSVIVTFQNLTDAKRVRYELSYIANGVPQGAMGTVQAAGLVSDSRDLYFGTCSHGVCTPHYNISNTTLVITTELTSGGTYTKRYRIKI